MVVLDNHLHFVPLFLNKRKQKRVDSVSDVAETIEYVYFQSFSALCWGIKFDTLNACSTPICWIQVDNNFKLFNLPYVLFGSERNQEILLMSLLETCYDKGQQHSQMTCKFWFAVTLPEHFYLCYSDGCSFANSVRSWIHVMCMTKSMTGIE